MTIIRSSLFLVQVLLCSAVIVVAVDELRSSLRGTNGNVDPRLGNGGNEGLGNGGNEEQGPLSLFPGLGGGSGNGFPGLGGGLGLPDLDTGFSGLGGFPGGGGDAPIPTEGSGELPPIPFLPFGCPLIVKPPPQEEEEGVAPGFAPALTVISVFPPGFVDDPFAPGGCLELGLCAIGRPFRDGNGVNIATNVQVCESSPWSGATSSQMMDGTNNLPTALGKHKTLESDWANRAVGEHASIASFAAFTIALMSNQAPPDLIRDSLRAAMDELNHATISFEMAPLIG